MLSNSISEGANFQNFLGGMPSDSLDLAWFTYKCMCFSHNIANYMPVSIYSPTPKYLGSGIRSRLVTPLVMSVSACMQQTSGVARVYAHKETHGQCILLCIHMCHTISTRTLASFQVCLCKIC